MSRVSGVQLRFACNLRKKRAYSTFRNFLSSQPYLRQLTSRLPLRIENVLNVVFRYACADLLCVCVCVCVCVWTHANWLRCTDGLLSTRGCGVKLFKFLNQIYGPQLVERLVLRTVGWIHRAGRYVLPHRATCSLWTRNSVWRWLAYVFGLGKLQTAQIMYCKW
jgi:hypothetical protein